MFYADNKNMFIMNENKRIVLIITMLYIFDTPDIVILLSTPFTSTVLDLQIIPDSQCSPLSVDSITPAIMLAVSSSSTYIII